jgi:hypothetical protein
MTYKRFRESWLLVLGTALTVRIFFFTPWPPDLNALLFTAGCLAIHFAKQADEAAK